jgi:hypothetical protein
MNRFQEAQRLGARREKESLDRARAISFRQQGFPDSPFADDFVSTSTNIQLQQQAVLPIEQEVDMRALRERDEQLRELEVGNLSCYCSKFNLDRIYYLDIVYR